MQRHEALKVAMLIRRIATLSLIKHYIAHESLLIKLYLSSANLSTFAQQAESGATVVGLLVSFNPDHSFRALKNKEQLTRAHKRLILQDGIKIPLPAPLIPSTSPSITHIDNLYSLESESINLKHCCSDYHQECLLGMFDFYHFSGPESGTIQVSRLETPKITQFKAYRNKEPSLDSIKMVNHWFKQSRNLGWSDK